MNRNLFGLALLLCFVPCRMSADVAVEKKPEPPLNYLNNPGWEQGTGSWYLLRGVGKAETAKPGRSGNQCIRLSSAPGNGTAVQYRQMLPRLELWGRHCRFSVWAKGKGAVQLGLHLICDDASGKQYFRKLDSDPVELTGEWRKIEALFHVTEPAVNQFGTVVSLPGTEAVCELDDASFTIAWEKERIVPESYHVTAPAGSTPEAVFFIRGGKKPLQAFDGKKTFSFDPPSGGRFTLKASPGAHCVGVYDPEAPAGAQVLIDYLAPDQWNAMDRAAKEIKLPRKVNLLFIGDSLSDFKRGKNYADKLVYWLNKYNEGKVSYYNAGVAGDWISALLRRLNNVPGTLGLFRYRNLFEQPWDYIFIFLGHNDTRLSWNAGKQTYMQFVPPERQKKEYGEVVRILKKRQPQARIVLMTPMCMNHKRSLEQNASAVAAKRPHTVFGNPEKLTEYGDIVKGTAAGSDLTVIDLLSASRRAPDPDSFFVPNDGVHLTQKGEDFIAQEMLRAWAEDFRQ